MELHCSQTLRLPIAKTDSLRPLWNYTALKRSCRGHHLDRV